MKKRTFSSNDASDYEEGYPPLLYQRDPLNSSGLEDESFFDLCRSFAQIELPESEHEGGSEKCPLCPMEFPLSEFAAHVYKCIRKLDDVEEKHQMQLDEKMAQRLQEREIRGHSRYRRFAGQDSDSMDTGGGEGEGEEEDLEKKQLEAFEQFKPSLHCPDGAKCDRVDAQHFIQKKHPRVNCPICEDEFEVYAINAHVSICIDAEPLENEPFARVGNSRPKQHGMQDDDDGTADEAKSPALGEDAPMQRSPSSALTTAQMKAMAGMIVEQKNLPVSKQDISLHRLLDTFASLGFTKDTLTDELSRTKGGSSGKDGGAENNRKSGDRKEE